MPIGIIESSPVDPTDLNVTPIMRSAHSIHNDKDANTKKNRTKNPAIPNDPPLAHGALDHIRIRRCALLIATLSVIYYTYDPVFFCFLFR